jgi:urocanate hydratase
MRVIKKYVDNIEEEIEDAKKYAEKYVECKAKGNIQAAGKYNEMANDELKHAMYLHGWAVAEIEEISKIYVPPSDMMEKWEHAHREYVEQVAMIKHMLEM